MAIAALVIFWLFIGLLVFFLAIRGGPRGAREALHGQSATTRRLTVGSIALVIAGLGIALPAIVLAHNNSGAKKNAKGGIKLNAQQQNGRVLFAGNCATCHTLAASNAVGKVGPNLDVLRPPASLVLDAVSNGRARGRGQMPAQLLQGPDEKAVASYVAAVAGH